MTTISESLTSILVLGEYEFHVRTLAFVKVGVNTAIRLPITGDRRYPHRRVWYQRRIGSGLSLISCRVQLIAH